MTQILRSWPVAAWSVVVCAIVLAALAALRPATWTSTVKVLYGGTTSDLLTGDVSPVGDIQRTLATQAQLVLGDAVLGSAADDLGVPYLELLEDTSVEDLPDSNLLVISVSGPSADAARRRAERVADEYIAYTTTVSRANLSRQASSLGASITDVRAQLAAADAGPETVSDPLQSALSSLVQRQIQLSAAAAAEQGAVRVIAEARLPRTPSSPTPLQGAAAGAVVGLVLGAGLILLHAQVRPAVWTRRDDDPSPDHLTGRPAASRAVETSATS